MTSCGHLFHQICLEKHLLQSEPRCPVFRCNKDIETAFSSAETEPQDPIDISSQISVPSSQKDRSSNNQDPPLFESGANTGSVQTSQSKDITHEINALSLKHISEPTLSDDKSPNKKVKKASKKKNKESSILKKLIKKLTSSSSTIPLQTTMSSGNFNDLYDAIIKAEERIESTNQEVLRCYYAFGKELEDRFEHYKKSNRERKAQKKLIDEVAKQLPNDLSRNTIEKRVERARKIYDLFSTIGCEKIQLVKSYSALRLSKLSWDEIDAIEEKFE